MERIKKMHTGEFVIVREISDIGETRENITRDNALEVVVRRLNDIRTELKWIVQIVNELLETPPCYVGLLGRRECHNLNSPNCNCKFSPRV